LALWDARICSAVSDMSYLLKMRAQGAGWFTDICADLDLLAMLQCSMG